MPWNPNTPGSTSQGDNQYPVAGAPATLVASAARTTTGSSSAVTVSGNSIASLELVISAVSGTTPTLVVSLDWSNDGTNWAAADPVDTFTSRNAAGRWVKNFTVKAQYLRITWTIGGTTPSFTFLINGVLVP